MTESTELSESTERLSKRVAQICACSRLEAERYIIGGWVTVDGVVIESPQHRVASSNIVSIDSKATLAAMTPITILANMNADDELPVPAITRSNHAADDVSDIRLEKQHFEHLNTTLPLQLGAGGLYILSQDARILRKLTEDTARIEQEYIVDVLGRETMPAHGMKQLNFALRIDGRTLPEAKVSWQNETKLRIAAKDLQEGQIAYMCEMVGLQLTAMKRIRVGSISMGKLATGQWRYLPLGQKF